MLIVSCSQESQKTEPHFHLFYDKFTPPTNSPDDCICGGGKPGATGRTLIANCPCCDGIQTLVNKECPIGEACNNKAYIPMRVTLPPDTTMRIRYIDRVEPIT